MAAIRLRERGLLVVAAVEVWAAGVLTEECTQW